MDDAALQRPESAQVQRPGVPVRGVLGHPDARLAFRFPMTLAVLRIHHPPSPTDPSGDPRGRPFVPNAGRRGDLLGMGDQLCDDSAPLAVGGRLGAKLDACRAARLNSPPSELA